MGPRACATVCFVLLNIYIYLIVFFAVVTQRFAAGSGFGGFPFLPLSSLASVGACRCGRVARLGLGSRRGGAEQGVGAAPQEGAVGAGHGEDLPPLLGIYLRRHSPG